MLTMARIKKEYGSPICRHCINEEFGANLQRRHCRYLKHSGICPRCGEKKHIVEKLTFRGYLKVISK